MLHILFFSLFVLLIIAFFAFKRDICSPYFIFSTGFFVAVCVCEFYRIEWSLNDFNYKTFVILVLGHVMFFLGALVVNQFMDKVYRKKCLSTSKPSIPFFYKKSLLVFFCVLQIIAIFLYAKNLQNLTGYSTIGDAIGSYNMDRKFGENDYSIGSFYQRIDAVIRILHPIWGAMFAYSLFYVSKNKVNLILLSSNFFLAAISTLLLGGRSELLTYLMFIFVFIYLAWRNYNNWNNRKVIPKKISRILFIVLIFIFSFKGLGTLIGREEAEEDSFYVFSVYCGAEIKLLDNMVTDDVHKTSAFGANTFDNLYSYLYDKTGNEYFHVKSSSCLLDFDDSNNYSLGNVRSCFAYYYIDFGLVGVAILMLIAGIISQYVYIKVKYNQFFKTGKIDFPVYVYSFMIGWIGLSFFSESFYSGLFGIYLWVQIILLYLVFRFVLKKFN